MNEAIASIVKEYVMGIDMADKVAGLVRPVKMKVGDVEKTYPVAFDVSHADCIKGKYNDLMPNSKYKSIMYFEDQGTTFLERHGQTQYLESRLRLVAWLDTSKFPSLECPQPLSSKMINEIISILPIGTFNHTPYHTIQIILNNEAIKSSAIFGQYTYQEHSQYLFYPYDYFALNLTVKYGYNNDC